MSHIKRQKEVEILLEQDIESVWKDIQNWAYRLGHAEYSDSAYYCYVKILSRLELFNGLVKDLRDLKPPPPPDAPYECD